MFDFKKEFKDLYNPQCEPAIVTVPEMTFIVVEGKGDPNTSPEYTEAIEILYGLSYAIKMSNKPVLEYVVAPLEGFWNSREESGPINKDNFVWKMVIRQPDFVTTSLFEATQAVVAKKKPTLDLMKANLIKITEGLCVQVMHVGSYDNEATTIAALEEYATTNGHKFDVGEERLHHEIYLSDPRKTAVEKLKTVIRYPIK